MDTTAAAELGMSIPGAGVDGVGFWDSAAVDQEAWAEEDYEGSPPGKGPIRHGGVGHGRHSAPGFEPMPKRLRNTASESPGHNEMSHVGSYANGIVPGGYDDPASAYKGGRNSHGGSQGGSPYKSNSFQGGYHNETQVGLQSNGGSGSGPGRGKSGTGSIFFKTKLCARFRAGNCPYNSNCNFAHGMEELRKPPPGWEDLVAAQEERVSGGNQGTNGGGTDSQGAASGDSQRYQKTRPCKKFLTEGGCPYGERCIFLHEEAAPQSKYAREYSRESAAINVTPSSNNGGAGGGGSSNGGPTPRPPNWKTRLCNKWETTGHCPFGEKCHFAHGAAELQKYGGGPIDSPPNSAAQTESKTGGIAPSRSYSDVSSPAPYVLDGHATGNSRQGSLGHHCLQKPAYGIVKTCMVWRGPTDGVSTIYGDWFDDNDWDNEGGLIKHGSLNASYDIGIEIDN